LRSVKQSALANVGSNRSWYLFTKKDDIFDLYNNFVFQKDYPLPSVKVNGVNLRLLFTCSLTGDGEPLFIGCRGGSNSLICENNDNWIPISLTS